MPRVYYARAYWCIREFCMLGLFDGLARRAPAYGA
jgi:hypothetical protein